MKRNCNIGKENDFCLIKKERRAWKHRSRCAFAENENTCLYSGDLLLQAIIKGVVSIRLICYTSQSLRPNASDEAVVRTQRNASKCS